MKGVCDHLEKKMIALEAYKAGVDILLMPEEVIDSITEIEKAIERGEITRSSLDEKVRKVLTLKAKAGLFEKNYNPCVEYDLIKDTIAKVENKAFISYLAKESVTLVTNHKLSDGTQALPIKSLKEKKIAYLGYDAENFGKESAELIRRYADVDTLILRGPVKDRDLKKAIRKLKGYDLVILGFNNTDSRPQFNFGVNPKHMDMMTGWAKEQDIIFMFMGNPYVLNKIEDYNNFKAFIVGYGNSVFNNQAAVQIVFGGIPSKGVLPVSAGEFKEGESVIIKRAVRPEIKLYSKDSTYRMEHGAIIGNHIVTPAGDTIWYNTPIDINPAFFEEMFSEICDSQLNVADNYDEVDGVLRALGMGDSKLAIEGNELCLTSTLDDMSKFFTMIMRNGEYGGETILKEPIMKRNGAFPVAKNGLRVSVDADTVNLEYYF
jgi:hypothetical protein